MGDGEDERARIEIDRARDALEDARVLFEGGGTDAGAINRLYYAAFHAAQATLYAREHEASSHGQVRQQFGQHVVLEGDATREEGRLLGTLYDYRQQADYGEETPAVEIDEVLVEVEAFLDHMHRIVRATEDEST